MSKSYRFDPDDDFGGDNIAPVSRKQLKEQRKARKRDELALDEQMQPDDADDKSW